MMVRAIRGAITVDNNDREEILSATKRVLTLMKEKNDIKTDDMISMFFTMTHDLNAAFPAVAAREIGYNNVPLMCMNEINVVNSLEKCIRIMIYINTEKENSDIKHIYLEGATSLRPDISCIE